jgi:hypothetical protein
MAPLTLKQYPIKSDKSTSSSSSDHQKNSNRLCCAAVHVNYKFICALKNRSKCIEVRWAVGRVMLRFNL